MQATHQVSNEGFKPRSRFHGVGFQIGLSSQVWNRQSFLCFRQSSSFIYCWLSYEFLLLHVQHFVDSGAGFQVLEKDARSWVATNTPRARAFTFSLMRLQLCVEPQGEECKRNSKCSLASRDSPGVRLAGRPYLPGNELLLDSFSRVFKRWWALKIFFSPCPWEAKKNKQSDACGLLGLSVINAQIPKCAAWHPIQMTPEHCSRKWPTKLQVMTTYYF